MGTPNEHLPVLLFAAVTVSPQMDAELIKRKLQEAFGKIEEQSRIFDFDSFTDYYRPEMGSGLQKFFLMFEKLIAPEQLPEIKLRTNDLERQLSGSDKRSVNIDPGYVSQSKMVLATTKDYSHRLYLSKGIFGDLHLVFTKGSFQIQPWTYPDYQQPWVIELFNRWRERYRSKLAEEL